MFAVAAMLVAVLGIGVGAIVTNHGTTSHPSATTQRPLTGRLMSDGQVVGEVTISSGQSVVDDHGHRRRQDCRAWCGAR